MPAFDSNIIVPLYQYPVSKHAWQPLHDAVSKYPKLNFVIIINPNSGPGVDPVGWLPDRRYTREIRRLTTKPNVRTVGYVRLDYCRRPLEEIKRDIRKYANWSNGHIKENRYANPDDSDYDSPVETLPEDIGYNSETVKGGKSGVGVSGIFFDETPNLYEEMIAEYLTSAGQLVKDIHGLLEPRMIIHNPGTVPDPEYIEYWQQQTNQMPEEQPDITHKCSNSAPDDDQITSKAGRTKNKVEDNGGGKPTITTVFEESHALWLASALQTRLKKLLRYDRDQCCYMVHSVPMEATTELVSELRRKGRFIFVTDVCENPYEKWGSNWGMFIDEMASNHEIEGVTLENTD